MKKYNIVAITNCPAGIAHTFMVAEALEKKAKELGHSIKVETQGAGGVENHLTEADIEHADFVVLALGRGLSDEERKRFVGKRVTEVKVSEALKHIDDIFENLESKSVLIEGKIEKNRNAAATTSSRSIMPHLMSGVSAALPFVVGGGLLIALASILKQFGFAYTTFEDGAASFAWIIEQIGYLGFKFMIPIMGAYIAYSIADKPAFAPAFIITYFANDGTMLGKDTGAGFFGAIFFGLLIGYFVRYIKSIRYPQTLKMLMNMTVIPFVTTFIFGLIAFYIIGPFLGDLMETCLSFLNDVPSEYKIPLALLIGGMIAFDMGGPIGKIAWLFSFSLLSEGVYTWYAIVGVVGVMPAMSAGIACYLRPSLFSEEERASALSAIIVGSTATAEPAIPYAMADPIPMIAANVISGSIASAFTILFGIERIAPGIGILDPFLGLITPVGTYFIVTLAGIALNIFLIITFKTYFKKRRELKAKTRA